MPLQLVMDGSVHRKVLETLGKDKQWVEELVASQRVELKRVILALLDSQGDVWLFHRDPMALTRVPGALQTKPEFFDRPFPAS